MTPGCAVPETPGLITGLLADTDCQAFGLVERGYAALSAPGGEAASALTAIMVIAVAIFGYQLILGRGISLASVTGIVIRFGIVLLLATSWSTVQAVAFDSLARAPTRIAESVITGIDQPAPLVQLQNTLERIEAASVGWRQRAGIASPFVGGPPATAMALSVSSFLLTITTAGLLVVSRVVVALLLALTPIIAGFLLFDATRGLLEGWLRALVAAALVPVGVLVLTSVELAIVSPILDRILVQQAAGQFNEEAVTPLGLVTIVFAFSIVAAMVALASIARGIRISPARVAVQTVVRGTAPLQQPWGAPAEPVVLPQFGQPQIVRALESAQRRDAAERPNRIGSATNLGYADASAAGTRGRSTAPEGSRVGEGTFVGGIVLARPALKNRASRAAKRRDQ